MRIALKFLELFLIVVVYCFRYIAIVKFFPPLVSYQRTITAISYPSGEPDSSSPNDNNFDLPPLAVAETDSLAETDHTAASHSPSLGRELSDASSNRSVDSSRSSGSPVLETRRYDSEPPMGGDGLKKSGEFSRLDDRTRGRRW